MTEKTLNFFGFPMLLEGDPDQLLSVTISFNSQEVSLGRSEMPKELDEWIIDALFNEETLKKYGDTK